MVTTLTYTGGKLSSVADPAGRTTTFEHDETGNLVKITDPDGTFKQFSYDSNHRLISQTSKRGFVTTYQYNSAGRNIGAIRSDGSVATVSPQWMSALIDPSSGVGTQSNPAPLVRADQVAASYTDGNGKKQLIN
jgi:Rhs family protein